MSAQPPSDALVFFGATGDLAFKKIFGDRTPLLECEPEPSAPARR